LPPKIPVPTKAVEQGRVLRREVIAALLGGSLKVTFPYPRNRLEGPPYACLKESENELLPKHPGEHGIVIVKSLPDALVYNLIAWLILAQNGIYFVCQRQENKFLDLLRQIQGYMLPFSPLITSSTYICFVSGTMGCVW
jgi:hypothetical protein